MNRPEGVLVIEDHEEVREMVRAILEQEGYATSGAANGTQALHVLRGGCTRPRLIVLDLMMPGMGGIELLDVLSTDDALASIPVVVMTAHPDIYHRNKAQVAFMPLIPKPLDCDQLIAAVRGCCGTHASPEQKGWIASIRRIFSES
jgi:CheY-like chemotaxis protein